MVVVVNVVIAAIGQVDVALRNDYAYLRYQCWCSLFALQETIWLSFSRSGYHYLKWKCSHSSFALRRRNIVNSETMNEIWLT